VAAVASRLMQVYRDGDLALEQLMAFAITENHARQEAVYERLSYNRDASTIRRLLTETHVVATDRHAVFVGVEAYTEAGGTILRDLFTEDHGGYFEDGAARSAGDGQTRPRSRCGAGGGVLEMDPSPSRFSPCA
jgi:ParB family transcriptional regulator, chromosome partitioning protein